MKKMLFSAAVLFLAVVSIRAETFEIDPVHSSVEFRIKHLAGHVKGRFNKLQGSFDYEAGKPESWKASSVIEVASIDTHEPKRDAHLQTADFFDAAKCPNISFTGDKASNIKGNTFDLTGSLTIRCVTKKDVVLHVEIGEISKGPDGKNHAGASATTKIDRKDYGVKWNKILDTGGIMIGDDVEISIDLEGIAKK